MTSVITILFYFGAWVYMLNNLRQRKSLDSHQTLAIVAVGVATHAASICLLVLQEDGINLGVFKVASLFFIVINLLVLLSCLRQPLHNLFIFLMPMSIIGILVGAYFDSPLSPENKLNAGMIAHIVLSILAYSLLTIASFQAILLYYQNLQLKAKHFNGIRGIMPPLQTMETLLFEIVWVGFIFLTLSIATGAIYIEDIFAQHLSHKTVFSVLSWIIYAVLLTGHRIKGWRGVAAVKWVLGGFIALMLAYFGSKLVVEVILGQMY